MIGVERNVEYFHEFPFYIQSAQSIIKSTPRQWIEKISTFWVEFLAHLFKIGFEILSILEEESYLCEMSNW